MMKIAKKWWCEGGVALVVCAIIIFWGAAYIRRGDIFFFTDVGRDFLIYDEIMEKGLILIGPRTSIPGIFHGPLWAYSNMPAYLIGGGNPAVIGVWWLILVSGFLVADYYILKKIANQKVAMVTVILLALFIAPYIYRMTNPYGAFLLSPILLATLVQYKRTNKWWWLVGHVLISGAMIRFEMAAGVPLFLITLAMLLPGIIRKKQWRHLLVLGLILLPLANYVVFELRHGFPQVKAAWEALLEKNIGKSEVVKTPWLTRIEQRWEAVSNYGLQLFTEEKWRWGGTIGVIIMVTLAGLLTFKKKLAKKLANRLNQNADLFWVGWNYYVWFFVISLFFNGEILIWHYLPVTALGLIALAVAVVNLPTWLPKIFIMVVVGVGLVRMYNFSQEAALTAGQIEDDWLFQEKLGETIYNDGKNEFGYFIYTPDVWAYESKGMMTVMKRRFSEQKAIAYDKRAETYLIVAPFYQAEGVMQSSFWKKEMVGIPEEVEPVKTWEMPDGYKIEKYELSDEIVAIPESNTLDGGFNAR